jgi:arabinogalactan endo-1,4-beta-galactosidase
MLDFHYSDYWADPGKQYKPAAWENLNFTALRDSVRTYSANVIQALVDQGTTPDIVQIGNETTTGMLWDEGRVGGGFDTKSQWGRYTALTKAGIEGVREAGGNDIQIMIHIDRGGDANGVRWFFDNFTDFNVDFDLIGLSYYPFWHGDLSDLEAALDWPPHASTSPSCCLKSLIRGRCSGLTARTTSWAAPISSSTATRPHPMASGP